MANTGQNYNYNLNSIFFHDLKLENPDVYMDAVMRALQDAYWKCKEENIEKYISKKYKK